MGVSAGDVAVDREPVVRNERELRLVVRLDHDGGHRARAVEVPVFLGPDCQHQHANVADVVAKRAEHYVSSLFTEMSEHRKSVDEVKPEGKRQRPQVHTPKARGGPYVRHSNATFALTATARDRA